MLQLDSEEQYGAGCYSFSMDELKKWAGVPVSEGGSGHTASRTMLEIPAADFGPSRQYNIDLAPKVRAGLPTAPHLWLVLTSWACQKPSGSVAGVTQTVRVQVLFCSDDLIEILLYGHAHHYLEFKLLQGRCVPH